MSGPQLHDSARRHLVLCLGHTQVLLEPTEVLDIEAAERVVVTDVPAGGVGRMVVNGQSFPVFALSSNFDLQIDAPLTGRLCVLLAHPSDTMAVLCDKVDMLVLTESLRPLPAAMRLAKSPVDGLAFTSDGLACHSSAQLLISCVQQGIRQVEAEAGQGVAA